MATYKKGYKKQNSEILLLKTIVIIIISVILIVGIAFIIGSMTSWKNYSSYNTIDDYSKVFDMETEDEEPILDYIVYLYSDRCESCKDIRNDVLGVAKDLEKDEFYLLNIASVEGESDEFLETIGKTTVSTPTLVVVKDGEFYEVFVGSNDISDVLELIEDGTYSGLN
ncbi:MAG: thioredoxin family protein [Candidatus Izemoplasmatales bacterium]|nr:thioredoxin family protein [Candidatus Izemoplasmatales bacterium]